MMSANLDKTATIDVDLLREGIKSMLSSHPDIQIEEGGPTVHLKRYRASNGEPIGHEHEHKNMQNIWVRRDAVNIPRLRGLLITKELTREKVQEEEAKAGNKKGANSNLFGKGYFPKEDLVRFAVRDLWEAARILNEVADSGSRVS